MIWFYEWKSSNWHNKAPEIYQEDQEINEMEELVNVDGRYIKFSYT